MDASTATGTAASSSSFGIAASSSSSASTSTDEISIYLSFGCLALCLFLTGSFLSLLPRCFSLTHLSVPRAHKATLGIIALLCVAAAVLYAIAWVGKASSARWVWGWMLGTPMVEKVVPVPAGWAVYAALVMFALRAWEAPNRQKTRIIVLLALCTSIPASALGLMVTLVFYGEPNIAKLFEFLWVSSTAFVSVFILLTLPTHRPRPRSSPFNTRSSPLSPHRYTFAILPGALVSVTALGLAIVAEFVGSDRMVALFVGVESLVPPVLGLGMARILDYPGPSMTAPYPTSTSLPETFIPFFANSNSPTPGRSSYTSGSLRSVTSQSKNALLSQSHRPLPSLSNFIPPTSRSRSFTDASSTSHSISSPLNNPSVDRASGEFWPAPARYHSQAVSIPIGRDGPDNVLMRPAAALPGPPSAPSDVSVGRAGGHRGNPMREIKEMAYPAQGEELYAHQQRNIDEAYAGGKYFAAQGLGTMQEREGRMKVKIGGGNRGASRQSEDLYDLYARGATSGGQTAFPSHPSPVAQAYLFTSTATHSLAADAYPSPSTGFLPNADETAGGDEVFQSDTWKSASSQYSNGVATWRERA